MGFEIKGEQIMTRIEKLFALVRSYSRTGIRSS